MNNIFRNSLLMFAAAGFAVSCADYNETSDFKADPDPTATIPYQDYNPVKTYIDREKYPNMTIGATMNVTEFNRQEIAHTVAVTNVDNLSFGSTLMSGKIISDKGVMDFTKFTDLLSHTEDLGVHVFGSPLAANTSQPDGWLNNLTGPVKVPVDLVEDVNNEFGKMTEFNGTVLKGNVNFATVDGIKCLEAKGWTQIYVAEGFDVEPEVEYEIEMKVKTSKDASLTMTFAGNKIDKLPLKTVWKTYEFKAKGSDVKGYLLCDPGRFSGSIYYAFVRINHYPNNRRPQTDEERRDTLHYAIDEWCDGLMKNNAGRVKQFDLIEDAIDMNAEGEDGICGLKTSNNAKTIFWQDVIGAENYAPAFAASARKAYAKYGGNPDELQFFLSESNLDNEKKFNSLKYWMTVWEKNGAQIDGISAKLNISYYEDAEKQSEKFAAIEKMLVNLAATGKLVRICDFDIKYINADGVNVPVNSKDLSITDEQRQKLADYYAQIIRSYMTIIPSNQQAGICKGNLVDTGDPVGLWKIDKDRNNDWVRTATYKAFCDALSGK